MNQLSLLSLILLGGISLLTLTIKLLIDNLQQKQNEQAHQLQLQLGKEHASLKEQLIKSEQNLQSLFNKYQISSLQTLQDSLQKTMGDVRQQLDMTLDKQSKSIELRVDKLTQTTEQRLQTISGQVEKRLSEGFDKTHQTFTDIVKRLAQIDAAQKKISELSENVVSLQQVLSDKHSRGAFGEVQLAALVRDMLPESRFSLQATLSNGKRPDCLLYLPEPTGNVAVDAKFPLNNYRTMLDNKKDDVTRKQAEQQFKIDIRKHINDIASKYIIPPETSDSAVMFIPSEAVFAEIHGHFPDLVEIAYRARVWLVSPTTMMAILTTARAVVKDAATRQQVHIIQEHLGKLGKDFSRFEKRMDNLSKHINQAQQDVTDVNTSAKKISQHFHRIEQVELSEEQQAVALED